MRILYWSYLILPTRYQNFLPNEFVENKLVNSDFYFRMRNKCVQIDLCSSTPSNYTPMSGMLVSKYQLVWEKMLPTRGSLFSNLVFNGTHKLGHKFRANEKWVRRYSGGGCWKGAQEGLVWLRRNLSTAKLTRINFYAN